MSDDSLINEVGLLFFDAMSVRCEPSSYAKRAISLVRAAEQSALSDAQIDKAVMIACSAQPVGAGDGGTYVVGTPTRESMRAAVASLRP